MPLTAPKGSRCAGTLVPVPAPGATLDGAAWLRAHAAQRQALSRALETWPVDVVDLHGLDWHHYLPPPGPPALVTLHLPAPFYPPSALRPPRPDTFLHCVSASQRALFPPGTALLEDVPNGVDLSVLRPGARKGTHAVALGRICEAKGFHLALEAAARAGVPLLLAGAVHPFPEHLRFFEAEIRPRLDARRRFLGPASRRRKRRLLSGARCVVVPSLVPETSSLVAIEALASGTPVVAFRRGALPDIVEHGVTGFLVDSVDEMADALRASPSLRAEACRRAAEERFSARETVRRYLALYERLASGCRRPRRAPAPLPGPRSALRIETSPRARASSTSCAGGNGASPEASRSGPRSG